MKVTKVDMARTKLVLAYPFFASLLLKHPMVVTELIETAAVDSSGTIFINPSFAEELTVEELVFLFAHEVMHVVYAHRLRMGNRDHEVWNNACDAVINAMLKDCNVGKIPEGGILIDGITHKSTAEEVYVKLMSNKKQQGNCGYANKVADLTQNTPGQNQQGSSGQQGQGQDGNSQASNSGRQPTDEEVRKAIADGKQELAQAYNAMRMRGIGGGAIEKYVGEALASRMPWHKIMENYFHAKCEQKTQWTRPNKRYLDTAYMPRRARFPSMGRVVIGIDTSGSISDEEIKKFIGHVDRIVEDCHPESVDILYVTEEVEHTEHYEDGDYPIEAQQNRWCGGTDMREVVHWAENNCPDADLVVVFTDGWTPFTENGETLLDVLWVMTEKDGYKNYGSNATGDALFTEGE